MQITLKEYQQEIIDYLIYQYLDGYKRFTVFIPVGFGKTLILMRAFEEFYRNDFAKKCLIVVPRKQVALQINERIRENDIFPMHCVTQNQFQKCIDDRNRQDEMNICDFDFFVLMDASPLSRKLLYDRVKNTNQIVISVSSGPYKYQINRNVIGKTSLFVDEKKKENRLYIQPGIYLFPTQSIVDIRDLLDSNASDFEEVKETILKNRDYFISLDELTKNNSYDLLNSSQKKMSEEIIQLKKREKELLEKIQERENSNE